MALVRKWVLHLACHNNFLVWADGVLQKCGCVTIHVHTSEGGVGGLNLITPTGGTLVGETLALASGKVLPLPLLSMRL